MKRRRKTAAAILSMAFTGCTVGPNCKRPNVLAPNGYKSPATRSTTQPALRPEWWLLYNDDELTALETAALAANFDIQAVVQRVEQARQATAVTGASFYPTVTLNPQINRTRSPASNGAVTESTGIGSGTGTGTANGTGTSTGGTAVVTGAGAGGRTRNVVQVPLNFNYELDVWGRIRRPYESSKAPQQATIDDLAVVRQTVTTDLAQDYFTLHSLDAQIAIITRNVDLYRKQVGLAQPQNRAGLVGQTDVLQAQAQLDSTLATLIDTQRQRDDIEHAIAILIGRPPVELTLHAAPLVQEPPVVPPGLPSDLLRQRPDVGEAEQNLIQAGAQVGVATANFYPGFSLTGAFGFESTDVRHTSIGPTASGQSARTPRCRSSRAAS